MFEILCRGPRRLRKTRGSHAPETSNPTPCTSPPNDARGLIHKTIIRAATGFLTGGPAGALRGALQPSGVVRIVSGKERRRSFPAGLSHHAEHVWLEGLPRKQRPRHNLAHSGPLGARSSNLAEGTGDCPGAMWVKTDVGCVHLLTGDTMPQTGGETMASGGGGSVVEGAWGMPAVTPDVDTRRVLDCPRGMVLGIDDLCYPKAVLSSRNVNRKWRRPPKPTVSRRDEVAIRRAAAAKDRVLELAKDVGLHASKTKPAGKAKAAPAVHMLKVVHEETN